jgi:hypothetical protein
MIQLTEEQCREVESGRPVVANEPEIGSDVIVLSARHLTLVREMLADIAEQEAILRYSMEQAREIARENPY